MFFSLSSPLTPYRPPSSLQNGKKEMDRKLQNLSKTSKINNSLTFNFFFFQQPTKPGSDHRMVYFCNRKCNAKSRTERTCARIPESCPVNILVSIFQPASQQEESFILNGSQVHHHPVVTHLSLFFFFSLPPNS